MKDEPFSVLKISLNALLVNISFEDVLLKIPLFAIARSFSSEIKSMPLDVKISALLLIGKGDSKTGMRKPISQARHYYPKPLPNTDKIYEILTGETLKK